MFINKVEEADFISVLQSLVVLFLLIGGPHPELLRLTSGLVSGTICNQNKKTGSIPRKASALTPVLSAEPLDF